MLALAPTPALSVVPSGLPESLRSRDKLLDLPCQQKSRQVPAFLLSRQVSNLNSSDPESDVLPITPRDNFAVANIKKFRQKESESGNSLFQ